MKRIYNQLPIFMQQLACAVGSWPARRSRYAKPFGRLLEWLQQTDRWSYDELAQWQNDRLRELTLHCYSTVPYYTRLFQSLGMKPGDVSNAADLKHLPVLSKETVRQSPGEFISQKYSQRELVASRTSGTTGAGLTLYHTPYIKALQWAIWWRFRQRFGIELPDLHANFAGQKVVPLAQKRPPYWRSLPCLRQTYFSIYHMGEATLGDYVRKLQRTHFRYITGYPSSISILADYMLRHDLRLPYKLNAVTTGSESLLDDQRQVMAEAFECPVVDQYGAAEHVCNISQCPSGLYHVDMELGIVEFDVIDDYQDGTKAARVLATGLQNFSMPLMRYDIGDVVTIAGKPCSCGRQSPAIISIDGRTEGIIETPSGRRIGRLAKVFAELPNVRESQIVQDSSDHLTITVAAKTDYSEADEMDYRRKVHSIVGDDMSISFKYADSIAREKNGKLRAVKNVWQKSCRAGTKF